VSGASQGLTPKAAAPEAQVYCKPWNKVERLGEYGKGRVVI
jgi:hypothetical protein